MRQISKLNHTLKVLSSNWRVIMIFGNSDLSPFPCDPSSTLAETTLPEFRRGRPNPAISLEKSPNESINETSVHQDGLAVLGHTKDGTRTSTQPVT